MANPKEIPTDPSWFDTLESPYDMGLENLICKAVDELAEEEAGRQGEPS